MGLQMVKVQIWMKFKNSVARERIFSIHTGKNIYQYVEGCNNAVNLKLELQHKKLKVKIDRK